ncbi:hypothetical protein R1flu_002883 [Riccia fluitans]|uniref:Uncharacterized protein n=1 Tax=Riccia fluitans TaxID=41844 RepID=A0ABD1Y7D7_9MARC
MPSTRLLHQLPRGFVIDDPRRSAARLEIQTASVNVQFQLPERVDGVEGGTWQMAGMYPAISGSERTKNRLTHLFTKKYRKS